MATASQFVATVNAGTPGTLTAANTAMDGTGATGRLLVFTAGSNGSLLEFIRFMHKGTNVATLLRIWRNNGSDPETASNNTLIGEQEMAANTISHTTESLPADKLLNVKLANGERIYVTLATAVAAGIHISPMNGGDF